MSDNYKRSSYSKLKVPDDYNKTFVQSNSIKDIQYQPIFQDFIIV